MKCFIYWNKLVFAFILILSLNNLIFCKIWTPEELSKEMKTWNSLVDPESFLVEEENFAARIHNNYLKTNKIYDKVDVNIFVIPRIPDKYAYTHSKYADELIMEIEKNPDIKAENRKSSFLIIVFALKQNNVIIKPSDKLKKILSKEKISSIVTDVVETMKNKNYARSIIFLFEKLDALWNKYKKPVTNENSKKKYSEKDMASKMDTVQQIQAILFIMFVGFVLIVYLYQKWARKNIKKNDKTPNLHEE